VVHRDPGVLARARLRPAFHIALLRTSPLKQTHFRKNLFRKTATLVYTLEEYLLSGLIPEEIQQFVDIIIQCYLEAGELEK
jgi:hypothetical protein